MIISNKPKPTRTKSVSHHPPSPSTTRCKCGASNTSTKGLQEVLYPPTFHRRLQRRRHMLQPLQEPRPRRPLWPAARQLYKCVVTWINKGGAHDFLRRPRLVLCPQFVHATEHHCPPHHTGFLPQCAKQKTQSTFPDQHHEYEAESYLAWRGEKRMGRAPRRGIANTIFGVSLVLTDNKPTISTRTSTSCNNSTASRVPKPRQTTFRYSLCRLPTDLDV